MKLFLLLGVIFSQSLIADGIGFNVGPFSLQLSVDGPTFYEIQRPIVENPLCLAITQQNQLEFVVERAEKINAKELKIVTKKLIVEPYGFGFTQNGRPVLKGNVVEEKLIKEVNVKYGEDQFDERAYTAEDNKRGFFSGWFKSDSSQNIDLRRISDIHILSGTHFDAPKNYKGFEDPNIRVVCQLPISQ